MEPRATHAGIDEVDRHHAGLTLARQRLTGVVLNSAAEARSTSAHISPSLPLDPTSVAHCRLRRPNLANARSSILTHADQRRHAIQRAAAEKTITRLTFCLPRCQSFRIRNTGPARPELLARAIASTFAQQWMAIDIAAVGLRWPAPRANTTTRARVFTVVLTLRFEEATLALLSCARSVLTRRRLKLVQRCTGPVAPLFRAAHRLLDGPCRAVGEKHIGTLHQGRAIIVGNTPRAFLDTPATSVLVKMARLEQGCRVLAGPRTTRRVPRIVARRTLSPRRRIALNESAANESEDPNDPHDPAAGWCDHAHQGTMAAPHRND